jgi:predicted negative regulator of RcsB-dependent stress response
MDTETQSTEFYFKVLGWMHAHRKALLIGAIVALAIGLIAAFLAWKSSQDELAANALFFAIPIETGSRVAAPSPTAFLELAQEYPGTAGGEHAELLGAELLFTQGKYPEAEREFTRFGADHPDDPLVSQSRIGVAACVEAEGKTMDAIQKYREIILAYPGEENIVSPAKLTMARLCEEANPPQLQQALTYYSELARILTQNPYDPWASEGRERGALLFSKHPELARSQASAAPAPSGFSISDAVKAAAPATTAPAPKVAGTNQGVNLLSIPGVTSKTTGKP